ncbi:hypothetical protein L1987_33805 [Smallanthus sonchifolius]|uniref:Uncharacterized protein n=1 Tax=Smallanthus sonchifolius TaxID=185202 RepID=A0ACB9HTA0_9ASTR|nr:hypothetical protein L1987_33805 [Smallanthus sonchifolius]
MSQSSLNLSLVLSRCSIAVVQANSNLEDQVYTSPSATYIGVYDGHGVPEASRFVNSILFPFIHKYSSEQGGISADVINKAFNATKETFFEFVKHQMPIKSTADCRMNSRSVNLKFNCLVNPFLTPLDLGSTSTNGRTQTVKIEDHQVRSSSNKVALAQYCCGCGSLISQDADKEAII